MEVMKLDKVLSEVEKLSCADGELHKETCILSVLDYLAVAGLPGASDCYVREMEFQYPGSKISPPGRTGVSSKHENGKQKSAETGKYNSSFFGGKSTDKDPPGVLEIPKTPKASDLE